jgi:hypothetical protein
MIGEGPGSLIGVLSHGQANQMQVREAIKRMKYSMADIDEMRKITADLYRLEIDHQLGCASFGVVENRLQTYLAHGVSVDEMRAARGEMRERNQKQVNG